MSKPRRARRLFVAISAAALLLTLPAAAAATRTGKGPYYGTVAFLREPPGGVYTVNQRLYVIHADGSGLKAVTPAATPVLEYAWSPNGRLIAYIDSRRWSLWLVRPDGTGLRRLLSSSRLASEGLSWSPDGREIAITSQGRYEKTRTGSCPGAQIYIVPIHHSQPRLLRGTSACGDPAWSRWGEIAYDGGGDGVWVVHPDGSGRRQVSRRGFWWVRWSADGRRLAFCVTVGRRFYGGIAAVDGDGLHRQLVTRDSDSEYPAEWSPLGRRILYGRADSGGIDVVDGNGRNDARVTSDSPPGADWPALGWSPNGSAIVYTTPPGDLYLVGADGSDKVQLTNPSGSDIAPSWVAR